MNIKLEDIRDDITLSVKAALAEDIGEGDITAMLIPEGKTDTADIITRDPCTICGVAWVNETFAQLGGLDSIEWHVKDGDHVPANTLLVTLSGNSRRLLTGERTALNFLQLLSGTATKAKHYADLVKGTSIKILDTRKTLPGLRTAQKYAVVTGGCHSHRIGLFDAFLIKENHIAACGSIAGAINQARSLRPNAKVEIEVETIEELQDALLAKPDVIMLDNFSPENLATALKLKTEAVGYEISGGVDEDNIKHRITQGIDFISTGQLTKEVHCIDLSMRIHV